MSNRKNDNIKRNTGLFYLFAAMLIFASTAPAVLGGDSSDEMALLPGTVAIWRPIFMIGAAASFVYGVGMLIAALWEKRGSSWRATSRTSSTRLKRKLVELGDE